jgi:hypothetical protein
LAKPQDEHPRRVGELVEDLVEAVGDRKEEWSRDLKNLNPWRELCALVGFGK